MQLTKYNNLLSTLILDDIPPMPRGKAQIWITLDIDANSIINVDAVEKSSGKKIKWLSQMIEEDLAKMILIDVWKKIKYSKKKIINWKKELKPKIVFEQYYYK